MVITPNKRSGLVKVAIQQKLLTPEVMCAFLTNNREKALNTLK